MGWQIQLVVLLTLGRKGFCTMQMFPSADDSPQHMQDNESNFGRSSPTTDDYEAGQLDEAVYHLARLLVMPWPENISPLLYVENNPQQSIAQNRITDGSFFSDYNDLPRKRTRYYRKYPWKRQNSKYDPENRFICNPSKDEVYRLLVALHEARQGNKDRVVDFCNRKRPAYAVYTNIRFLGK